MTIVKATEADAFVARQSPSPPVVLIFGPDAGLVSERAEACIHASVDDPRDALAVTKLPGDEIASSPGRLADEAHAIPMFGGRRAVWVRAGTRSIVPAIEAVLAEPPRECRIVIEAGDLKKNAPLRALCEKSPHAAAIACYADDSRTLQGLIDDEMRSAGLSIDKEARAILTAMLGGDRRASRNELRKLALHAHGKSAVTVEDIEAVCGDSSVQTMDSIVDAAFAGRAEEMEALFAKAMTAGANPGAIVGAALRQCMQLHKLHIAVDGGVSVADAVKPQVFFRRQPAWESALRKWSTPDLAQAMASLAETNAAVRMDQTLAESRTHRALMRIAVDARRK